MRRVGKRIMALALSCTLALALGTVPLAGAAANASQAKKSQQAGKAKKNTPAKSASAKKPASAKQAARGNKQTVAKQRVRKQDAKATRTARNTAQTRKARADSGVRVQRASLRSAPIDATIPGELALRSSVAYVQDLASSDVVFAKNEGAVLPIASITKLMTALVVVDAGQPLDELIEITVEDIDTHKNTHSRLAIGTRLSRADMLHLALMSSENRAANALGRNYPGGLRAFVEAMNVKARLLGMTHTRYVEPTGLSSANVSSPRDLVHLLRATAERPLIRRYTTDTQFEVEVAGRVQVFRNTNRLVSRPDWEIAVSKTGFISEAGRCLVMLAQIGGREMAIVLLDSEGTLTRTADAQRIRQWLQRNVAAL